MGRAPVIAAIVCVMVAPACARREPPPALPPDGLGAIEGRVWVPGTPDCDECPPDPAEVTLVVRRDGAEVRRSQLPSGAPYRLELPPGRYVVQIVDPLSPPCDVEVEAGAWQHLDVPGLIDSCDGPPLPDPPLPG